MKQKLRTTLFASAIATLLAGPVWATSETPRDGASSTPATPATASPTRSETGQTERSQPATSQPMSETPRLGGAAYGSASTGTQARNNPLYSRSADDLDGVDVVDRTGDKVGDIKRIVLAPDGKSAHAVISVGGLLGMGARDIMIPFDDLTPLDDKLQVSGTKDEIESRPDQSADADRYVEVKGDTPISGSIAEFSAFEQDKDATKPDASPMTPRTEGERPATTPATPRVPQ